MPRFEGENLKTTLAVICGCSKPSSCGVTSFDAARLLGAPRAARSGMHLFAQREWEHSETQAAKVAPAVVVGGYDHLVCAASRRPRQAMRHSDAYTTPYPVMGPTGSSVSFVILSPGSDTVLHRVSSVFSHMAAVVVFHAVRATLRKPRIFGQFGPDLSDRSHSVIRWFSIGSNVQWAIYIEGGPTRADV